jgi:hypothetical protein
MHVQLLNDPVNNQTCLDCHAPLLEQRPQLGGGMANPVYKEDVLSNGIACASCHVREGRVYGPPATAAGSEALAGLKSMHGGFEPSTAFQKALFCAGCHQFEPGVGEVAGVPLENTFNEWQASPAAREGKPCQSCHMPDRRHLWKGIHDAEMTASGLDAQLELSASGGARFTVTNTGVGHYFPTYITPRATLVIEARGGADEVLATSEFAVQRRIDVYLQEQAYDSRLAPRESAHVELSKDELKDSVRIRAYVKVEPDEFYYRFFAVFRVSDTALEPMLEAAKKKTAESDYIILVNELEL